MTDVATQVSEAKSKATVAVNMPPEFYALVKERAAGRNLPMSRYVLEALADKEEYTLPAMSVRSRGLDKAERAALASQKNKENRAKVNQLLKMLADHGLDLDTAVVKMQSLAQHEHGHAHSG